MVKPRASGTLRVNVWNLIDDTVDGAIRGGLNRAQKHSDISLTEQQEELIVEKIHDYLMMWFSETFIFDDETTNES